MMIRTSAAVRTEVTAQEQPGAEPEDQILLATALAAALIEYRREVGRRSSGERWTGVGNNWRMVTCWERLRGRG